ncbi:MAG: carbohydrate kinase [Bacillaceae bacterium]
MATVYSIGEALIDILASEKGKDLKDVTTFERVPGGAPANVAIAVAKYGGNASLITQLGEDPFGDLMVDVLEGNGVATDKIFRTKAANTGLAFVSIKEDGERDFSFYRNPSADLLLQPEQIEENWFSEGDILHFCSVDLVESPMKHAHEKAIQLAKKKGALISFDPNIRTSLWNDLEACKQTVNAFLPYANVVKVSDEELEFITGYSELEKGINALFVGDVEVVVYTKGAKGATIYTKETAYESAGFKVTVADTTGAGDAFIGGFLYKLMEQGVTVATLKEIVDRKYDDILTFSNASGALTASVKGAIHQAPGKAHVLTFIEARK